MTWRLLVGQLRAHRGYFAWTVTLLGLLAAILTYIVVAGATQAELSASQSELSGQNLERSGWVRVTEDPDDLDNSVTPDRLRAMIDSSPTAIAVTGDILGIEPLGEFDEVDDTVVVVLARYGDSDLAALLQDGRLPQARGEVALAANVALELGVETGDSVELFAGRVGPEGYTAVDVPLPLTVVGITAPPTLAGYDAYQVPGALLDWSEVEPGGALTRQTLTPNGDTVDAAYVDLHWEGNSPQLDPYLSYVTGDWNRDFELPQSTVIWMTLAFVLVVGMIIMSFAVGRAQAVARTRWIATARTLGATRWDIAGSTILETIVMALVAVAVGTTLGILAAQVHLSLARAASGFGLGPERVSLHWSILPTVMSVTMLVAVLIAAVPAFWASRVEPVAALKPINDITEAELSRRVSPHLLWIPTVLGIAFILIGNQNRVYPDGAIISLGLLIASVGIVGLIVEATRWSIPWVGQRMARSSRSAVLAAGDALAGRPRLAVAPALITLTALCGFTLFTLSRAASLQWQGGGMGWFAYSAGWANVPREGFLDGPTLLAVALGAIMVQLIASAIFVAHRTSTAREVATRRALGLGAASESRAQWWQQVVPQALGAVLGVVFGSAIFWLWAALQSAIDDGYEALSEEFAIAATAASLAAALVLMLAAGMTAWIVARIGWSTTPLARLNAAG